MEPLERHLLGQSKANRVTFWHRVRARGVLRCLPAGEKAVVADIGAGAGTLGRILRERRPQVDYTYFEPISSLAGALASEFGETASLASADAVSAADVVTLLDVIEHIEDDHGFVRDVVTGMSPGARMVVTVPALQLLWSPWDEALGHHRRYNLGQIESLFATLPVRIDESSWLFFELLPAGLVRRLLGSRGKEVDATAADFPVFPPVIDRLLFRVSSLSFDLRRFAPAGTSLLLIATRT